MPRTICVLVLFVGLLAFTINIPDSAPHLVSAQTLDSHYQDQGRRCTLRRLRGTYSVQANGTVVTPPSGSGISAGPFATVGTLEIDAHGNAILNATRSFNGQIVPEVDLPGTLTLHGDCTGSATFQGGRTFDLVVLESHGEMQWIQTNPGTVVTVSFKRL